MNALITGSSGFCGQHLSRYLREQGVEVFTLAPRPGGKSHYQIKGVNDLAGMLEVFQSVKPDFVFHLAGMGGAENPTLIYQVNLLYGLGLLHAMDLAGQKYTPVLLTGTAAEYGLVGEDDLPVSEDFYCAPYNHYGSSKLAQTLAGLVTAKQGPPVVITRAFNIIGPGMPDHLVLTTIAKQVQQIVKHNCDPLLTLGNVLTSRDLIDIRDVLPIYWKLIRNPAAYGEIVNVCTGRPTAIQDALRKMISLSGKEIEVVSKPERFRAYDPMVSYG